MLGAGFFCFAIGSLLGDEDYAGAASGQTLNRSPRP
jgi:hypothetical protein